MAGSDSLESKQISSTYKDLLQVPNANSGVDGTARTVMDGEGTESALQVSTAGVKSTGTLESTGNLTVGGTLTLGSTEVTSTATELNLLDGVTAVDTDLSSVSSSDDTLASAKSIKTYVDSQIQSKDHLSELSGTLDDITTGTTNVHFTASDNTKLDGIETGAEVNVNADWDATSGDAQILNKPSTFTPSSHTHAISEVTNLQTSLDAKQATVTAGDGLSFSGDTLNAEVTQAELDAKIANVSEDTTPQLGGPLDTNGQDIVSTSNADIEIAPNGTGKTVFKGNTNAGKITLNCENNSHGVSLASPANADYSGSWTLTLPTSAGSNGQVLTTNGSGVTSWAAGSSVSDLNDLSDVNAGSPSDGQVLKWNQTASEWQAMADNNSGGGGGGGGTPAGSTGQIQFNSGGSFGADSNLVWDDANDRLGVGGSPSEKLHVSGGMLQVDEGTTGTGSVEVARFWKGTVDGGSKISLGTNTTLGQIESFNDVSAGGSLRFYTKGSSTLAERMRIDSDGRVHVRKYAQFMQNDGTTVAGQIGNANAINGTNQADLALHSTRYVEFSVGGNSTPKMVLDSGGNLALGHAIPSTSLHIAATSPVIKLEDTDATGTPECDISGAGGDLILRADKDNEKSDSLIGFEVDGTERMRIDSDGIVSISSALSAETPPLKISQSDTGDASIQFNISGVTNWTAGVDNNDGDKFKISNGSALSSNPRLTVDSSGNLAVGTTQPSSPNSVGKFLHIHDSAHCSLVMSDDSNTWEIVSNLGLTFRDGTDTRLAIDSNGTLTSTSTSADAVFLKSSHANNTNVYIANTNATTSNTANLYFAPANDVSGAKISAIATEDFSTSANRSADLALSTRNNGSWVEAMRIDSSGNLGVGSSNPSGKLEVNTGSGIAYFTRTAGDDGSTNPALGIGADSTKCIIKGYGGIQIETAATGGSAAPSLTIDSSGNVGIGTASPSSSAKLHVLGEGLLGNATNKLASYGILELSRAGDPYLFLRNTNSEGVGNSGFIEFYQKNGNGSEVATSRIGGSTEATHATQPSGNLKFYTASSGGSLSERLRIASTGRVTVKKSSNAEAQSVTIASNAASIDLDAGNNFEVSIPSSGSTNIETSSSSGLTVGQSGVIRLAQGGGATTFSTIFKWQSGTTPTPSTSGVDLIAYYVDSSTTVSATYLTNVS